MTTIEKIIDARSRYIRRRHHYGMRARYDACYGAWLHKLFRQMAGCENVEEASCDMTVTNCSDNLYVDFPPDPPASDDSPCIFIAY